ncbi:MAG: SAM-dependent DNA methyltransferase, partial [Deltaproteobacteria bacterium]|nr:SAM-dependent DNA methyltransferase [Deltaproteobacteria bacterium]MBW2115452.1 SAM-dependent DNA methyltransferase [Deltaproteobacteria bacterium]
MASKRKIEFGDFQTPLKLSEEVVGLVKEIYPDPSFIVEPTCGLGTFIKASMNKWGDSCHYYGFDINEKYVKELRSNGFENGNLFLAVNDFFNFDWSKLFKKLDGKTLIVGNPPWVTSSALGLLNSNNLPEKSNFQRLGGFAAKTGKANFDIAEWMLIKLIESLRASEACLAMLCKTATARKVLKHFWTIDGQVNDSSIHIIDAKRHFDVSVDACLFVTFINPIEKSKDAYIYENLSFTKKISHIGIYANELIANIDEFNKSRRIDGIDYYKWRSGLKHDAAKVMELEKFGEKYINGFGESVELENEFIYPLLKSSDLGNERLVPRKYVIVTQKKMGDNTKLIQDKAPKTWAYLESYSSILDNRKSIIYKKRPRFSVFGIGDYSFTSWKVAISGLYKNIHFSSIGQHDTKPIMVDDTCYFIPCSSENEATFIAEQLNSETCLKFIKSLIFFDAKRPVNIDILSRIDLKKLS